MRNFAFLAGAALSLAVFAVPGHAGVVSMAGDADCFGLGGTCAEHDLWRDDLGGVFFTDYSQPGDPAHTDIWEGQSSVSFALAGGPGSNYVLELFVAGIADGPTRGPDPVFFNGTQIGLIDDSGSANAFQEVRLFQFSVAPGLIAQSNTVLINIIGGDGYSFDYAALLADDAGAVPEPASWAMMIGGFAMAGGMMRRRKSGVRFA